MNFESVLIFASIAFVATVTPGPAIMLVSINSIQYGVSKSVITIFGNITGLFLMSLLAVLGLSTVILYSAPVFLAVKIIGALYLIYLGVNLWRKGFLFSSVVEEKNIKSPVIPKNHKLYLQGLFISLSNPKAIAFTTALFPQFIDSSKPLPGQFFTLVSIFMLFSFISLASYAAMANKAKGRASNIWIQKLIGKAFASIFVGSGVALALTSQKSV